MDSWSLLCTRRRAATKPFLTWDGPEYSWAKQTKPGGGGPRCRGAGCGSAKGDWSRAPRTAGWRKLLYVRPRKRRGRHPTLVAVGSLRGRGPGHEKKSGRARRVHTAVAAAVLRRAHHSLRSWRKADAMAVAISDSLWFLDRSSSTLRPR
jgi:hypothetical protein